MFNIDFVKLIRWFTPYALRDAVTLGWVRALCAPAIQMYNEFITKRKANLYRLSHDSRVFSIRAVLNDRFDSIDRRIYITKGLNKNRIAIYTPAELRPLRLGTVALYNPADYNDTGVDFIVYVPNVVTLNTQDLTEMNYLVNDYALPGKRFKIYRV